MGSLNQLLAGMIEESPSNFTPTPKKVRCSCGQIHSTPGYDTDVKCVNCVTITQTNNDILTGNYGMQRDKILERKKINQIIPADAYIEHFPRTIDNR